MNKSDVIYVAGHTGLVGSAVVRKLMQSGFENIVTRTHKELNLCNRTKVRKFFQDQKINSVFMCAGRVGGIMYNLHNPFRMLYDNTRMSLNVIESAKDSSSVEKLIYLGSSCMYPSDAPLPLKPESLLSGKFTSSNEAYALAKMIGLKACEYVIRERGKDFITAIPCNIYGPGDNFNPSQSHFIAGIMKKLHLAKVKKQKVTVLLGTGTPKREVLYVDDLAEALIILMARNSATVLDPVNIGSGYSASIYALSETINCAIQGSSEIAFEGDKFNDGVKDKVMDVEFIKSIGWRQKTNPLEGFQKTYAWALENKVFKI